MRPNTPGTLNSSAGFKGKKLPKLRKEEEAKEHKELPSLLDTTQAANSALFKSYLSQIQDAINHQDLDRKIRSMEPGLSTGQSHIFRRWLRQHWDNPTQREEHSLRILKGLNAESIEDAFPRIYKAFANIDVLLTKATELVIVNLLKYEESLLPVFEAAGIKLSTPCSSGVVLSKFNAVSALVDRFRLLAEISLKKKAEKDLHPSPTAFLTTSSSQEQLKDAQTKIADLTNQLQSAKSQIDNLVAEKAILNDQLRESAPTDSARLVSTVQHDMQGKVPKAILEGVTDIIRRHFESSIVQLKRQYEEAREQATLLRSEIQAYKTIEYEIKSPIVDPAKGDYEECLGGQLAMMQRGYQKKISDLKRHQEETVKNLSRRESQTKQEISSLRHEQQLLLRKWQMLKQQ